MPPQEILQVGRYCLRDTMLALALMLRSNIARISIDRALKLGAPASAIACWRLGTVVDYGVLKLGMQMQLWPVATAAKPCVKF